MPPRVKKSKSNAGVSKEKNIIHPRSRKANQLQRAQLRHQKISGQKASRNTNLIFPLLDRLTWFQLVLDPEVTYLQLPQVHLLIKQYLGRFDEELQKLREAQRPGRPIPKRVDEIETVRKAEREEYTAAGFQIPDLSSAGNVAALKNWDGTREALHHVKLTRLKSANSSGLA